MPLVTITMRKGTSKEHRRAIMGLVHQALVECFKIPESDRNQRIVELDEENLEIPAGKTERFTTVEMTVFPGRSKEAKRKLYQTIVTGMASLGHAPADVMIILNEPHMDNWGIRGGTMASEVDLGFDVKV